MVNREHLLADVVQGRDTLTAGTCHVDTGQVERQAQQAVAHRIGDEFVYLVTGLIRQTHQDGAGSQRGVEPAPVVVCRRVEESVKQGDIKMRPIRVDARDRIGQHRVAETVDCMGKFCRDRRIEVRLVEGEGLEGIDQRLDLARELLEHQMLVFHLGDETGGLEQTLFIGKGLVRTRSEVDVLEIRQQRGVLGPGQHAIRWVDEVIDQAIMLGMEDLVYRGQRNVLVAATVTADEMQIKQFIIVLAGRDGIEAAASCGITIRGLRGGDASRICAMGNVVQEGRIDTYPRYRRERQPERPGCPRRGRHRR